MAYPASGWLGALVAALVLGPLPGVGGLSVVLWAAALTLMAASDQKDYTHLVGKSSKTCGRVVTYTNEGKGCGVRLDLGRPYWNPAFYVVVPDSARAQFTSPPDDAYLHQDICVTGFVEAGTKGIPHVVALSPSQVEVTTRHEVKAFGTGVHRACGPVKQPKLVKEVQPNYSREGIAAKIEGRVLLDAVVGIDGKVTDMRVVFGLLDSLDHEAREAVKKWRFEAGTLDGVPVPTIVQIELSFTLRK
jgi:TonB family protein